MSYLTFYYGTMESGKTTKLIQDNYNYRKHDIKTIIVKPATDTKGENFIINRRGDKVKVDIVLSQNESLLDDKFIEKIINSQFILTDESQFFTKQQIDDLWFIAHYLDISVIAYGLKNNFKGELFEGSSELFSRADFKHELTVNCACGAPAMFNARLVNNEFISEGDEVLIDGAKKDVKYVAMCADCYLSLVENKKIKEYERRMIK